MHALWLFDLMGQERVCTVMCYVPQLHVPHLLGICTSIPKKPAILYNGKVSIGSTTVSVEAQSTETLLLLFMTLTLATIRFKSAYLLYHVNTINVHPMRIQFDSLWMCIETGLQ